MPIMIRATYGGKHRRGQAVPGTQGSLLHAHRRTADGHVPIRPRRNCLLQQAITSDSPVMFYEPKRRYHERAKVVIDELAGTPFKLH